ncbi:DUF2249 domain-containing protein [Halomontanus rarus]|uniref:DUF2249 domain-containing protein n=1 Tax=Halomontanus rarus TaxID=3034020 RepID=UPI001A99D9D1
MLPADRPSRVRALETAVRDRLAETGRIDVADDAVDLRGRHPRKRYELVRDAFTALEPGDRMHVVSDRDPTAAGEFLVDLLDATGPPADVLEEFTVERRGPDEWVLVPQHP